MGDTCPKWGPNGSPGLAAASSIPIGYILVYLGNLALGCNMRQDGQALAHKA